MEYTRQTPARLGRVREQKQIEVFTYGSYWTTCIIHTRGVCTWSIFNIPRAVVKSLNSLSSIYLIDKHSDFKYLWDDV